MSRSNLSIFLHRIIQFFIFLFDAILKPSCSSDRPENTRVCADTQHPKISSGAEQVPDRDRWHLDTYRTSFFLPENIEEYTFNKDVTVLVIGKNDSGKRSLINAYDDAKRINRFYFPSENIHFFPMDIENFRPYIIEPDVIWFVVNYLDCTHV